MSSQALHEDRDNAEKINAVSRSMLCRGQCYAERVTAMPRESRLFREGPGSRLCEQGQYFAKRVKGRGLCQDLCAVPPKTKILMSCIDLSGLISKSYLHCIDLTSLTLEVLPTFVDLSGFTLEDLLTLCRSNQTYTKDQFCAWSTEVKANCPPVFGAVQRQRHHCGADWGAGREYISE